MRAEYRVARAFLLSRLEEQVNKYLAEGFSLAGPLQVHPLGPLQNDPPLKDFFWFYQPMFRPAGYRPLKTED